MSSKQKLESHLVHLKKQHKDLKKQIEEAYDNFENDIKVSNLKFKKLQIKDEIELVKKIWRLWAKALGEKASVDDNEADKIALIRSMIVAVYIVTNFIIIAGVLRHWND